MSAPTGWETVLQTRVCKYCGREYLLDRSNFGSTPSGGFRYKCRSCVREAVREYNAINYDRASDRSSLRRTTIVKSNERNILYRKLSRRHGQNCYYCKNYLDGDFHFDHLVPISRGGEHTLDNIVLACMQCNQEKYNKTIEEYRQWKKKNRLPILF